MINANETIAPCCNNAVRINAAETIAPDGGNEAQATVYLVPGESIGDSYIVHAVLATQGKQASVYIAKRGGKPYVIKVYRNGWKPSEQMQHFLKNVNHPNVATIVQCGEYGGQYYEIYEYYEEGTLAEVGAISATTIQKRIVPSLNEGLHELHKNGVIHCDIKPSNLYFVENRTRVVIGDCGISGYANANGKLVDAVRGTPEYAPRVKALLWSAAMSPAYDYGSLGLVLCKMALGRSIFDGMSIEEISRAWENGIQIPSQINGRLLVLIKGLLNEDENERWGYLQVKRWCEGEYVTTTNRTIYARKKKVAHRPLIFGRFDDQMLMISTPHQLARAIKQHWEQATRVLKRREMIEFARQFDQEIEPIGGKKFSEHVVELARQQDLDTAVFQLLLLLDNDGDEICYCNKVYANLNDYIESLSIGKDEVAKRFLQNGLFVYYLRKQEIERGVVDEIEHFIKRNGCEDRVSICALCASLRGTNTVEVFGATITSLDELVPLISKRSIKEISALIESAWFQAWLYQLGYEKELQKWHR